MYVLVSVHLSVSVPLPPDQRQQASLPVPAQLGGLVYAGGLCGGVRGGVGTDARTLPLQQGEYISL